MSAYWHFLEKNIFIHISFIETGSEEVIPGVKILDDRMINIDNNEYLTFYMESYEECQLECNERYYLLKSMRLNHARYEGNEIFDVNFVL